MMNQIDFSFQRFVDCILPYQLFGFINLYLLLQLFGFHKYSNIIVVLDGKIVSLNKVLDDLQ